MLISRSMAARWSRPPLSSPPPHERHLGRHDRHRQDVGRERQARHVQRPPRRPRSASIVGSIAMRPSACGTPVVIRNAISVSALPMSIWPQAMSNWRQSSAIDFVRPGDRVFGRGIGRAVGARRVRRDRAVVDDAAAARALRLHQPDRALRAEKRAGQIGVDDGLPLRDRSAPPSARRAR